MIKLGTVLVNSSDKKSNSEGSSHRLPLASFVALSEVHSEVTHGLGDEVDLKWFYIVEFVILSLYSSVVD